MQKKDLFENTPIPRAVITLGIPTVISSLVMVIYNLADTYFVGMLNSPAQNAAVTLAAPVLLAFNAINNLFGIGSSSMMSRALGSKDYETVARSSAFGFYCSLILGIIFSLVYSVFSSQFLTLLGATGETVTETGEYLKWTVSFGAAPAILNVVMAYLVRAEGSSLHASIGSMSGCILNIILDPIFVLPRGLNMGAAGAGFATFISNCVACAYFFVLLFVKRKSTFVCINPKKFSFTKKIVLGVFAVGIPASIQNLLNVIGMTVLNNFSASFGADAVAAMGIAQKINMVPVYITFGLGQGIMPLIGYNYASGDIKRLKKALSFCAKISVTFMVIVTLLFYFTSGHLIRMFIDNARIISYGTSFLRGFCIALPFFCIDFLAVGVFQACGMGGRSLLFAILRKIVLEIPALLILNYLFPLYGLAYAQFASELILGITAVIMLISIIKKLERKNELKT